MFLISVNLLIIARVTLKSSLNVIKPIHKILASYNYFFNWNDYLFYFSIFISFKRLVFNYLGLNFHLTSINHLNTSDKKVLLTFDDGPHANTIKVLEVLKKHDVKAVFFIIGKNIQANEAILKQIVADGHQIGNHSFSHHNWIDVWSTKKVTEDFAACKKLIEQYQPNTKLFRPPYGVTNPNISKALKQLNLQSIGWNVRSYDTSIKDVEKIKQRVISQLKPGAIILLHDRLDFMPELLETLIPAIKEMGYNFENKA